MTPDGYIINNGLPVNQGMFDTHDSIVILTAKSGKARVEVRAGFTAGYRPLPDLELSDETPQIAVTLPGDYRVVNDADDPADFVLLNSVAYSDVPPGLLMQIRGQSGHGAGPGGGQSAPQGSPVIHHAVGAYTAESRLNGGALIKDGVGDLTFNAQDFDKTVWFRLVVAEDATLQLNGFVSRFVFNTRGLKNIPTSPPIRKGQYYDVYVDVQANGARGIVFAYTR